MKREARLRINTEKGDFIIMKREDRINEVTAAINNRKECFTYDGLDEFLSEHGCYQVWGRIETEFADVYDEKTDEFLFKLFFSDDGCCDSESIDDCEDHDECEEDGEFFWECRCGCGRRQILIGSIDTDENAATLDTEQLYDLLADECYTEAELDEIMKDHGYHGNCYVPSTNRDGYKFVAEYYIDRFSCMFDSEDDDKLDNEFCACVICEMVENDYDESGDDDRVLFRVINVENGMRY